MNCPVCNRNNAVTLSICPSCGAMINDSVREELVSKVSVVAKPLNLGMKKNPLPNTPPQIVKTAAPPKPATTEIATKPTSPTLVEFHSKNTTIPEWRLQIQNAVRQRQELERPETQIENFSVANRAKLVTSGANALKAEVVEEAEPILHSNPDLARALNRIKESRQKFLVEEKPPAAPLVSAPKTNKNYPFYIAAKTNDIAAKPAEANGAVNVFTKPKLASSLRTEKEDLDTNKLPPIPKPAQISTSFAALPAASNQTATKVIEPPKPEIKPAAEEIIETKEVEEFDDSAPFAMRFNAGLFDLIIGSFASLLLLAPFILWNGSWISAAGFFAFVATCAIVMFIYLTTAIGLYGRTFGMHLFSLELVDIDGENYPTLHQAAVSSAVYLLSLAFGGLGFLTVLFNEDNRAVHDLLSGTIVIKE